MELVELRPGREHLFISYASEDWIFAEWLALKLASEGYRVWYDRIKLLGGESYPRDITAAIKNQTFRVLALLSRNSIEKPNPVKERTLALNIAKELLTKVLHTYSDLEGKPLREIFLHYRAFISFEEFEGFRSACPSNANLFCVRIRQEPRDVRLYREGTRPILRGTFLELNPRRGYLWTSGFKPFLGTYDGWEIPVPLRIDLQYGNANITQIARDILGLTKLNYNECKYGDSNPVTIGFSDAVGEILVSNPKIKNPSPKFKYYI